VKDNPNLSFVFVGQVLDKEKFDKLKKTSNLYFLGDKKYDVYPCYVNQFDIGIIPYEINEKQHGGDSIKAYEYLQAGKKVIGTKGNGLMDLSNYLHLAEDKYQFSKLLKEDLKVKKIFKSKDFSWKSKATRILSALQE
jgi:glycosyltransferase involved in cell wall biosynthesis